MDEVDIRGFQNHVNSRFTLGRVTTFVGPTDSGKSAVLRAVRWACVNEPAGDEFVNHDSDSCRVKLKFGVNTVGRHRGKKVNKYVLNGTDLKPFGVPDLVRDLVNVTEDNFGDQLDPVFWLTLRPGEASKRLNAVVNLGLIDRTLAAAGREVHRLKVAEGLTRDRLKSARAERDSLRWAEEAVVKIEKIEKIHATIAQLHQDRLEIARMVEGISRASETIQTRYSAVRALRAAIRAEDRRRSVAAEVSDLESLLNKLSEIEKLQRRPLPDLERLSRSRERLEAVRLQVRHLQSCLFAIQNLNYEIDQCDEEIEELDHRIRSVPRRCPVCGNTVARKSPSSAETSTSR